MKNLRARNYSNRYSRTALAIVFATLCTLFQTAELWNDEFEVKAGEPAPVSLRLPPGYMRISMIRSEFFHRVDPSTGCSSLVPIGKTVSQGEECAGIIGAFENSRRPLKNSRLVGSFMLYFMVGFLLINYMSKDGMGRSKFIRSQVIVLLLLLFLTLVAKIILLFTPMPFEVLPVAMVPIIASMLLGKRLSFGIALASSILVSSLLNFDVQAVFIFLVAGIASVSGEESYRNRTSASIFVGIKVAFVTVAAVALTTLLFSGTLDIYDDLGEHINPISSIWLGALYSGIGAGILSALLMPLASFLVGEVPRGKLLDHLELDHPLLRQVRNNAPSTWEHSRTMANLGEAAAHAIGVNAMLLRVGAYFHDVGKSLNPNYFIENQTPGENPHDDMSPSESAKAIFAHVIEGVKLLRKEHVPEDVIEFAYSHHGTSILEYFWIKSMSMGNPEHLREEDFRYPGHRPTTKETAILMIVDATEAAARTISEPTRDKFESLLQRIVFGKMAQAQFDESGLTMTDLRIITNTIVDTLVSMNHSRIKYPWQKEEEEEEEKRKSDSGTTSLPEEKAEEIPEEIDPQKSESVTISSAKDINSEQDPLKKVDDAVPTLIPPPYKENGETETTYTGTAPKKPNPPLE